MRGVCCLCGRKITANRSSHLRKVHGIDSYKGAIKEYFLRPEEVGLSEEERMVREVIAERFKSLPFCERWLRDVAEDLTVLRSVIRSLVRKGYLRQYPVLVEVKSGAVSQFEETVYISKEGVIVTSNPKICDMG